VTGTIMVSALEAGLSALVAGLTLQVDEQPSPLLVFPSSHSSLTTNPSPHFGASARAELQFGLKVAGWRATIVCQGVAVVAGLEALDLPVAARRLETAQGSAVQAQPGFHLQVAEHACDMFVALTPGSHCSIGASTMPSPQSGTRGR